MTAHLVMPSSHAVLEQQQAVAWLGRTVGPWQVRAVAGGQWGGTFETGGTRFSLNPGWVAGVSVGRNLLVQQGLRPYVGGSAALAVASSTGTDGHRLTASDMRVGCDVGWLLANRLYLQAVGRLFGGPVFWHNVGTTEVGGDRWHVQLGAGAGVHLGAGLAVFAEAVPLGETGASAGLVASW
ncbi:MAG: hypothetical protein EXR77_19200 [Myxococcales bacterium]|nr:hypothetical protein [Myxococcales bacterium]